MMALMSYHKCHFKGAIMSTNKDYLNFLLDQLSSLEGITYRMMMGEYVIYFRGKVAAYVCDNRLLIKPVPAAINMLLHAEYDSISQGGRKNYCVLTMLMIAIFSLIYSTQYMMHYLFQSRNLKPNKQQLILLPPVWLCSSIVCVHLQLFDPGPKISFLKI